MVHNAIRDVLVKFCHLHNVRELSKDYDVLVSTSYCSTKQEKLVHLECSMSPC